MTTIFCPNCGTENLDSATNCTQCRINLNFPLEHPEALESPIVSGIKNTGSNIMQAIICPNCGAENKDDEIKCKSCGEELPISSNKEVETKKGIRSIVIPCLFVFVLLLICGWVSWRIFIAVAGSMAECPSSYAIKTYLDENRNGILDSGEPPLPRVQVFAGLDTPEPPRPDAMTITDPKGEAKIGFGMMNANMLKKYGSDMKIYVEIPTGYFPTTPMSYAAKTCEHGTIYFFGFIAQPGLEPTP